VTFEDVGKVEVSQNGVDYIAKAALTELFDTHGECGDSVRSGGDPS